MVQLIFIAYVLLVIALSLIPTAVGESELYSDKLAHLLAYGGMGFLAYMSVDSAKKRFYLFLLVISLGVVLEFIQSYIPGRSASFLDIVANTLGAGLGYFLGWIFLAIAIKKVLLDKELTSDEATNNFKDNLK